MSSIELTSNEIRRLIKATFKEIHEYPEFHFRGQIYHIRSLIEQLECYYTALDIIKRRETDQEIEG
jgi:hypothetical protein